MKINVDGQVYEYDESRLMNTEAIALQRATGMKPGEFGEALNAGDAIAITGIVWLAWRREGRKVRFEDVEFNLAAFGIEGDEPEPEQEEKEGETGPTEAGDGEKTTSKPDETPTSSPSLTTSGSPQET